ncbi:MAG: acetate/propionate family kinase [Puniceicoccaceae bacterium]|nr:MAG: acetate/propionate family kinase [Puniceicoccaceae bacterium]
MPDTPASGRILVANIGSTSFKFRLFSMPDEQVLARGGVDRIGAGASTLAFRAGKSEHTEEGAFPDYAAAIARVEALLTEHGPGGFDQLDAVGFKPVMAKGVSGTQHLDERVLGAMEALNALFPAHNPPYIAAVRTFRKLHPGLPCIGTFETAFFDHLPAEARRFPIPLDWERDHGIRREGFHGASHRYISERAAELTGRDDLRLISCHLGGSSSLAAIRGGRAVDSSWGMTPQSGLPHNNRVGDMDVFAVLHLIENVGLAPAEVRRRLAAEGGLKGMSGLPSGDIRDLLRAREEGHPDATIALAVFVSSVRGYIGRLLASLDGADLLVFTAGIAENNPALREEICRGFSYCGLKLDPAANRAAIAAEAILSAPDSKIEVRLIPTSEEVVIARQAWRLLHAAA